ncbi:hypothetical protein scyTo_0023569, partial [Scyliorhinus torazame]|nr:hypothetical protein [Scyliorhinus torazame]
MTQPELVFETQQSRQGATEVRGQQTERVQLGTAGEQVLGEPAKSDPSSIDSSQEEDSLERLTPDSPFELLTEMQERTSCEEDISKPLLVLDEDRVHPEETKPFFFTGGVERGSLGERISGTKSEISAAIGQKSGDLEAAAPPCARPDILEKICDVHKAGDVFKQVVIAEDMKSSPTEVAFKGFQPSVCGSVKSLPNSNPWDLFPDKSTRGLEMGFSQLRSDRTMEPVSTSGTADLPSGNVCVPPKTAPGQVAETSVRMSVSASDGSKTPTGLAKERLIGPIHLSRQTSAEVSPRSLTDDPWPPGEGEEAQTFPARESSRLCGEPASSRGSLQTQTAARAQSQAVEVVEVDSSGESDDTVIEDLKPRPVRGPSRQKEVVRDPGDLEKPVLVPTINVTETLEQVSREGEIPSSEGQRKLALIREESVDGTK